MPELPDVTLYLEALQARLPGRRLEAIRIASPFLLRTVAPPPEALAGRPVTSLRRIGKRLAIGVKGDLYAVLHLMIAGRLKWLDPGAPIPRRLGLAAFDFETGTLLLTEAGTKKRAALHIVEGETGLRTLDRGGLEVLDADLPSFREALTRENHTLKRTLTDPRLLSGIGNAYSDEILHRAGLSPLRLTTQLSSEEIERLFAATRDTLQEWIDRLRAQTGDSFPKKVTAFRPEMAVHGRYRKPCPVCATPVQRIAYAENECNYCPRCQTGGRVLADRALSKLLRKDWPRRIEELEERLAARPGDPSGDIPPPPREPLP
jgi:formamidopyrimidine-DNA glycosylase